MTSRTFIALEIPYDALAVILNIRDKFISKTKSVKWEPIEKLHVTLKFLGDTDSSIIDSLTNRLELLITKQKKFDLSFNKFGIFKRNNIPSIFWVGLAENEYLKIFAKGIDTLCAEFGFEKEKRDFKSHITLLRMKNEFVVPDILKLCNEKIPETNFTADKVVFFQSKLMPTGSIYKSIKSFIIS